MDLWNIKDLEPPPVISCKITTKEIDIRLLDAVLKDGVQFFENQQHLLAEAALLSRAVYRFKMKFRSSKDFKTVERLNHILKIYQQMHISSMLKILSDSIPQNYTANKTYMLTKNMVDYVLVRLQGLGKLLCRIVDICKVVSGLMQQRLRLGHFWNVAIVIFATAARVFVVIKNVLKYSCELYGNLLPYSSSLGNSGVQWLPKGYIFPSQLDEWLNIDWLDLANNVIEILDDEPILSYLKLTDSDDEVEFCDEYILVKDDSMICNGTVPETIDICEDSVICCDESNAEIGVEIFEDIGEVINISDTEAQGTPKRNRKRRASNKVENYDVDVGEVVNIENNEGPTSPRKKRKKRASNSLVKNGAQRPAVYAGEVRNIKNNEGQKLKKKRKKRTSKSLVKNGTGKHEKSFQQKQGKGWRKHHVNVKKSVKIGSGNGSRKTQMVAKKKLKRFGN